MANHPELDLSAHFTDTTHWYFGLRHMELMFCPFPGTGMFREENLRLLANKIGNEWREIGTFLGISYARLDQYVF